MDEQLDELEWAISRKKSQATTANKTIDHYKKWLATDEVAFNKGCFSRGADRCRGSEARPLRSGGGYEQGAYVESECVATRLSRCLVVCDCASHRDFKRGYCICVGSQQVADTDGVIAMQRNPHFCTVVWRDPCKQLLPGRSCTTERPPKAICTASGGQHDEWDVVRSFLGILPRLA
jgi:hypothetical protein